VTLLTKATTLRPDLPVFAPDFKTRPPSMPSGTASNQPINGHSHPSAPETAANDASATAGASFTKTTQQSPTAREALATNDADDEENESYVDHPETYPRPGHGLMNKLPPEQQDLQWLVEDDSKFDTFNHLYQVDANAAHSGLNGHVT
jgi:hypothetical protein